MNPVSGQSHVKKDSAQFIAPADASTPRHYSPWYLSEILILVFPINTRVEWGRVPEPPGRVGYGSPD
jgi:hypothetical protein